MLTDIFVEENLLRGLVIYVYYSAATVLIKIAPDSMFVVPFGKSLVKNKNLSHGGQGKHEN